MTFHPLRHLPRLQKSRSQTAPTNGSAQKPTSSEYFLQIEPASSSIPGWIITRKYPDFEASHEILSRISKISGVVGFSDLPAWRIHGLAECEGMKRFLEKHNAITELGNNCQGGFARLGKAWPNPQALAKVGGGMLDVLAKASQEAAEGGKALFGGVFRDGVGIKRSSTSSTSLSPPSGYGDNSPQSGTSRSSMESLKLAQPTTRERSKSTATINESPEADLMTLEFETQNPTLPPRPSSIVEEAAEAGPELPPRRSSTRQSLMVELPGADEGEVLNLPPPPSDMPDDYDHDSDTGITLSSLRANPTPSQLQPNPSLLSTSSSASNLQAMTLPPTTTASPPSEATTPPPGPSPRKKPTSPLSTAEAQFVVEIIFAIISELYTLSSAWVFRRSLLNVAKSILLHPEANTEDKAVGSYIRKIRESAFMTDEESKAWKESAAKDTEEEEEEGGECKREKARRLVRERGLPEAMREVMARCNDLKTLSYRNT
ncbi:hypothetical protein B9Z19DRAFT_1067406 [Tuber borchii]|uniref:PX domain-containing protein n=1 Tax=Tuber borchii TaxID=42251 RepID=A0A2T6ZJ52_TUBBO|nr:hypothetical protein B9Z19DRAFT_1067406 [Tuber borchii]